MRGLVIDDNVRREIEAAVALAASRPVPLEVVMSFSKNEHADHIALADRPADVRRPESQHVFIPIGYRASISFEQQPSGLVRHLSVSVDRPGMVPNMLAVGMLAEAFGFQHGAPRQIWSEEFEPGQFAINVAELVIAPGSDTRQ